MPWLAELHREKVATAEVGERGGEGARERGGRGLEKPMYIRKRAALSQEAKQTGL